MCYTLGTFLTPAWVTAYAFHVILSFYSFPSSFGSTEIQTGTPFHLHDVVDSRILLDMPSSPTAYQVTSYPNTWSNPWLIFQSTETQQIRVTDETWTEIQICFHHLISVPVISKSLSFPSARRACHNASSFPLEGLGWFVFIIKVGAH